MNDPVTLEIRIVLAVILSVAIGAGVLVFGHNVKAWYDKAQVADQEAGTLRTTSAIIDDGAKVDAHQAQVQNNVQQARAAYNRKLDEAYINEPDLRVRADRVFPDSLRVLARQRRLARERSGCVGSERQANCATLDAAGR